MGAWNDSNQRPSRGISARIWIALFMAFMGWMVYMNQVEENPITKEKQHVSISPAQEVQLGLQSAPQMVKEMGGEVPASDRRAQKVKRVGNYLVERTVAHQSPWQFNFHLLADTQTINAFALPGGQIFITLGLFNKLQSEAELAGVLAHEMGHVIERHSAQQMSSSQLGQILSAAVGTAASDNPHSGAYQIAALVNQTIQLKYSRGDESEADIWGLRLMTVAGYDPYAMIQVMTVLKSSGPSGHGPELFQTHPNPDLRIQQIKEYLKNNPPPPNLRQGDKL